MKQLDALITVTEQMQLGIVPGSTGTGSHNCRLARVGNDLLRSPSQIPCTKKAQRNQVVEGQVHLGFEHFEGEESETSVGSLFQIHSINK